VPSWAEGRLNQLILGKGSISVATLGNLFAFIGSGLLNWWINRVPASHSWGKGGSAASAEWQVTLRDPIWHAGSRNGPVLAAQTAIRFL